ncbi:MAG: SRPBCC domain-containing protein [Solirubrobacteraceae bacterium]
MGKEFEVQWEGELPATPQEVWEAFTVHTDGWLWKIEYEPRIGGAEHGLTSAGGTVTAWDPPRHFTTRAGDGDGFNELDYVLEPRGAGTHLRYGHRHVIAEDYERQLDACRQHTAFYYHSLGEYVRHFSGRQPAYVAAEAPEASAQGGFAALLRALGVAADVTAGDRVRLAPAGLEPIEGVVDYATHPFLGVRSADALYRFYGRDAWGWPVGVAHHLFADGADAAASERAWSAWLDGVFATEAVA